MSRTLVVDETELWPEDVLLPTDSPCAVQGCHEDGLAATYPDRAGVIFLCYAHAVLLGHCLRCGDRTPGVGPDNLWCSETCAEDQAGIEDPDVFLADLLVQIAQIQTAPD